MPFTYTKPLPASATAITSLFERARAAAAKEGGTITGNEQSGNFNGKTPLGEIAGTYTVNSGVLNVTINKKPMLVPQGAITSALDEYFA